MITAVVFDLDDTLYPEQQFVLSGFRAVGDWLEEHYGQSAFFGTASRLFDAGSRGDIFNRALGLLDMNQEEVFVKRLVEVYRQHKPALSLYEDAAWAINRFKAAKKLGLITDGYLLVQQNKVSSLGISRRFDAICYSDQYGRECWKPSPVPYRKIMDDLDCGGNACAYIADNPAKDFVTARALGWLTFQIDRQGGEYAHLVPKLGYEAHCRISSLYELDTLIDA